MLDALARMPASRMFAAPTMVSRLINHGRRRLAPTRAGSKTIVYGGAPMYLADLKRALELFGPKLYHLYGQGESPMTITGLDQAMHADDAHPSYEERLASAGVARTGVAVRVVGEDGQELPPGEIGEIVTAQRLRHEGLLEQSRGQRQALRDGWLWTGDLGAMDARRLPHPQGPLQGHDHLRRRQHLSARDRGGAADASRRARGRRGRPAASRLGRGGRSPSWCAARAPTSPPPRSTACASTTSPASSGPKGYRFVDALPKNNYGKILKTELRQLLEREG